MMYVFTCIYIRNVTFAQVRFPRPARLLPSLRAPYWEEEHHLPLQRVVGVRPQDGTPTSGIDGEISHCRLPRLLTAPEYIYIHSVRLVLLSIPVLNRHVAYCLFQYLIEVMFMYQIIDRNKSISTVMSLLMMKMPNC